MVCNRSHIQVLIVLQAEYTNLTQLAPLSGQSQLAQAFA
jgi:hypothetical protein